MKTATMLYKCPGFEVFEGVACETTIVEEEDVAAALDAGWHRNWIDAGAAHAANLEKLQANEAEAAEVEQQLAEAPAASVEDALDTPAIDTPASEAETAAQSAPTAVAKAKKAKA